MVRCRLTEPREMRSIGSTDQESYRRIGRLPLDRCINWPDWAFQFREIQTLEVSTRDTGAFNEDDTGRDRLERSPEMGPEMREFMMRMMTPRNTMLLMAASTLVMYPVFGALGALLGTMLFRKKSPPMPS